MGHLSQQLGLIDALQRLGVAYHFEREIQEALEHIYTTFNDKIDVDDLYKVSLSFRLLRQEGFKVSCGKTWVWLISSCNSKLKKFFFLL